MSTVHRDVGYYKYVRIGASCHLGKLTLYGLIQNPCGAWFAFCSTETETVAIVRLSSLQADSAVVRTTVWLVIRCNLCSNTFVSADSLYYNYKMVRSVSRSRGCQRCASRKVKVWRISFTLSGVQITYQFKVWPDCTRMPSVPTG